MINNKIELIETISKCKLQEHTSENVELKRSWTEKYGRKISALCNKYAYEKMWMVIGVEDDGELSGHDQQWAKKNEEVISQQLNRKLDPSQALIALTCENINTSWIVILELVNPGTVVRWDKEAYKASGTTSIKMSPDEIMKLTVTLPGLTDYSNQKVTRDTNPELLNIFCDDLRKEDSELDSIEDNEDILKKVFIYGKNTENILLGNVCYRVVKTDVNDNIIENSTHKGLYRILTKEFFEEIKEWYNNQSNTSKIVSNRILRESLTNAVAHAAYNENHGEIIIELFPSRLNVSNLCFPEYITFANKWFSRIHKSPNILLMETLRLARKVDELGRGKNIIFSESLKNGYAPPIVEITNVGRFNRWSLIIYCGVSNEKNLRLFYKIKEHYNDDDKSLIALALILWRNYKVTDILSYFGKEEYKILAEVLTDFDGPIFYYKDMNKIVLNRWVRVLLEEGKESKSFTPSEEENLYKFVSEMQLNYRNGYVSLKDLRKYGHMGESRSEQTLSSKIMTKWLKEKKVKRIYKGVYKFINTKLDDRTERALKLLEIFERYQKDKGENIKNHSSGQ